MRYAQRGGLSDERRQFREWIRMKAAERFASDEQSSAIAKELRVSVRSIQRWRRASGQGWPAGSAVGWFGLAAQAERDQVAHLERELAKGPVAAHGWRDQ